MSRLDPATVEHLNRPVSETGDATKRVYPPPPPKPCNDCPWRRDSMRGWLGPFSPEKWLESAHGETPVACHQTIPEGGGWGPRTLQCRGLASFRCHVAKSPRNKSIVTGPKDPTVFATNEEFVEHHRGENSIESWEG